MNVLNARLDLTNVVPLSGEPTKWTIHAKVIDNTGVFNALDVKATDAIYNNCFDLGLGALRFIVLEILPDTTSANLHCIIKWDMMEAQPFNWGVSEYPIPGANSIIGATDAIGTMAITSMFTNLVDESFITAVRNIEAFRASYYVNITNPGIATGNPQAATMALPEPMSGDEVLISNADHTVRWSTVVDAGSF